MRSRPLAVLICVVILITSFFVVSSSAAGTENLIESDLTKWNQIEYDSISSVKKGDLYRLSSLSSSVDYFLGIVYDLPNFTAGHSYTLKFRLPSSSEVSSAWNISYTNDNFLSHYKNSTVIVGYGFLNSQGTAITNEVRLYEFNSSNVSQYFGTDLSTSFVAGTAEGRPVVFISISNTDGKQHHFFFSDFVLIDNDDNSGELKGIVGMLHSLRWDIVGGVCDNDDCAHSSSINPHLSLTERMTVGFSNLFDKIASKFEEGSTLNTWFSGLSQGVTNLGSNLSSVLNNVRDGINNTLNAVKSGITTALSDLGVDIDGFIDGAVNVIDGLFGSLFDWIETFKPRVYERFKWRPGDINSSTGQVVFKEDGYPYAIASEFFSVEPGAKAYLNFTPSSEVQHITVYQYDYYGRYVCVKLTGSGVQEDFELPSGFIYRFRVIYSHSDIELGDINNYVKVYTDEGWIMSFIHKIENFFTGISNVVMFLDWDGDYENPFEEDLPFVDFLRNALASVLSFINVSLNKYLELKVKSHAFNILFSYVLEEVPLLFIIGGSTLFLVVVSRFVGI